MLHESQVAASNLVRSVLPDVESYNADNTASPNDVDGNASTGGYAGMTVAILRRRYDRAFPVRAVSVVRSTRGSYCVQATVKGETASKNGPAAPILLHRCPATR